MKRFQFLYFLYRKGEVESSNKSKLAKAFNYLSDGHFYPDLDYLINEGLITEKNGYYRLGSEGRKEFNFYLATDLALLLSITFSLIFLWYYILSLSGIVISTLVLLTSSILEAITAILFFIIRRSFCPNLPEGTKSLKSRGIISRIIDKYSNK